MTNRTSTPSLPERLRAGANAAAEALGGQQYKNIEIAMVAQAILALARLCNEAADALSDVSENAPVGKDACSVSSRFWLVRYADGSIEDFLFYERADAERWIKREFPHGPESRGLQALPTAVEVRITEAEGRR